MAMLREYQLERSAGLRRCQAGVLARPRRGRDALGTAAKMPALRASEEYLAFRSSAACAFAIATALGCRSTITEPGAIPLTISAVISTTVFFAGNYGSRDNHIALGDDAGEEFALAGGRRGSSLGSSVATGILRIFGFDGQLDEAAAQTLHLLLRGGAHLVGRRNGAEPAGGRDGLQTSHSGTDDEYAGRSDCACSSRHHGKDSDGGFSGQRHRLVTMRSFPWKRAHPYFALVWCGAPILPKMM